MGGFGGPVTAEGGREHGNGACMGLLTGRQKGRARGVRMPGWNASRTWVKPQRLVGIVAIVHEVLFADLGQQVAGIGGGARDAIRPRLGAGGVGAGRAGRDALLAACGEASGALDQVSVALEARTGRCPAGGSAHAPQRAAAHAQSPEPHPTRPTVVRGEPRDQQVARRVLRIHPAMQAQRHHGAQRTA